MRILVVEDARDMNLLIVKTLKKAGYSVDGCYDGVGAHAYLPSAEKDRQRSSCQTDPYHSGRGLGAPGR